VEWHSLESTQATPALAELQSLNQWVNWIYNPENIPGLRKHKFPVQPDGTAASSTDKTTWNSYVVCKQAADQSPKTPGTIGGVGFVLANGYCGEDFDHVISDGQVEPWVQTEITKLNSYTEISVSGTGLHVIGKAKLPGTGKNPEHNRAEIYDSGRYFIVTGNSLPGTPTTINDQQAAAESFYRRIDHVDPTYPRPNDNPYRDFIAALTAHHNDIDALLSDGSFTMSVPKGGGHPFITKVVGYLWDGKRMVSELNDIARKLATFCQTDREITDKELADIVEYCVTRTPNGTSSLDKYKQELFATSWFIDCDEFLKAPIPPKKIFLTDQAGNPVLTSSSINQIFSFRGIGKSLLGLGLIDLMVHGGSMLGYKAEGGLKVLLCDGELPPADLQPRLHQLVGESHGHLKLMSPYNLPRNIFPPLADPENQREFLRRIDELKPDVIFFDTLTACFKFDTNDPDVWLTVNQFLIELRLRGICVILTHHAGKNGTQRGRSDGDDNLDLVMKLEPPSGHEPGQGLSFILSYEKVRGNTRLRGFQATYDGAWEIVINGQQEQIIQMLQDGYTKRKVKEELNIGYDKIKKAVTWAESVGIDITPKKGKAAKDVTNEKEGEQ